MSIDPSDLFDQLVEEALKPPPPEPEPDDTPPDLPPEEDEPEATC